MANFKVIAVLPMCFILIGCISAEQVPVVESHCLPMKDYTQQEQSQAAGELSNLPEGTEISKMFVDYGQMRSANRACLGKPN